MAVISFAKAYQAESEKIEKALDRSGKKLMGRVGGAIRKTAMRSLKNPPQMKLAEMTAEQRADYEAQVLLAEQKGEPKPRRPNAVSKPGGIPYLQSKGKSPLKKKIRYDVYKDSRTGEWVAIVGPEASSESQGEATGALEHGGFSTIVERQRVKSGAKIWKKGTKRRKGGELDIYETKKRRRRVRVKARPAMQPALMKIMPSLRGWASEMGVF